MTQPYAGWESYRDPERLVNGIYRIVEPPTGDPADRIPYRDTWADVSPWDPDPLDVPEDEPAADAPRSGAVIVWGAVALGVFAAIVVWIVWLR